MINGHGNVASCRVSRHDLCRFTPLVTDKSSNLALIDICVEMSTIGVTKSICGELIGNSVWANMIDLGEMC